MKKSARNIKALYRVANKRDALPVDLSISTLVNEFTDRLEVGCTICDPWLNNP